MSSVPQSFPVTLPAWWQIFLYVWSSGKGPPKIHIKFVARRSNVEGAFRWFNDINRINHNIVLDQGALDGLPENGPLTSLPTTMEGGENQTTHTTRLKVQTGFYTQVSDEGAKVHSLTNIV